MAHRVWSSPHQNGDVNLNQAAVHSENPLKGANIASLPFEELAGTDFLMSENLINIGLEKIMDHEYFKNPADSKILPPRQHTSLASSSNFQTSDQGDLQHIKDTCNSQEVVSLTTSKELQAEEKNSENEKIFVAEPLKSVLLTLIKEGGIDVREEIVETHETNDISHQCKPGIVFGDYHALEKLANDCASNKLQVNGTYGVITDRKFDFYCNQKPVLKALKILGRGGNGTVELYSHDDTEFVTKTIFRDFRKNEVLFTNSLSNEFIVKSHGMIVRNGRPQIIMNYAGINLLQYGLSRDIYESEIWNITFQMFEGLHYLHSNRIRHFDIKPENIILSEDQNGHKTLKIADFGGATLFEEDIDCLSWTPAYMSPEMDQFYLKSLWLDKALSLTSCGEVTEKCDIYALALSVLFLYSRGHILIKHVTQGMQSMVGQEKADFVSMKIIVQNAQNPGLAESLIPNSVGKDMKILLSGMLKGNVKERLTAKQGMEQMRALSSPDLHGNEIVQEPKKILRRKSKNSENKARVHQGLQAIRPKSNRMKTPNLVILKVSKSGTKVGEFDNLEIQEQQRPLRDLNIDRQLGMLMQQSENVNDEKLKQVIDEENRPLMKRLVKRKLKDKVNEEIAFKMTKLKEELENSGVRTTEVYLSGQGNPVMNPLDPPCDGPGNIPNFDLFM